MAILNTLRGTVESDPMRVPAPAAMSTGRDDSFAAALEDATAPRDEQPVAAPEAPADIDDEIAATTPTPEPEADPRASAEDTTVEDADATTALVRTPHEGGKPGSQGQDDTPRRGEGGRQATAGKGPHSPGASHTPVAGEPLLSELAERSARNPLQTATVVTGSAGATTNAGRAGGEPLLRGVGGIESRGNSTPRAAATKTIYRTSAIASAQLLDQARESVFKQIMLKITGDGGEMRMRLDPPELGELDLRMVVEGGNRMSLAINAERPDLADLIQRHIDELARALADVGLELTHSDVQSRDAGAQRDAEQDFEHGDGDDATQGFERPKRGGYIRADGLDFWV